jgi:ribulose-phosphate 3-epimerase
MIISPSLLAADFLNLHDEISRIEPIENLWLHLDVMDGHFVPNLTFGHDIIEKISKKFSITLDAHFMVTNPEFYIDSLKHLNIHNFTYHLEIETDHIALLKKARTHFTSTGISIKPKTPPSTLSDEILKQVDLVLVMSVEPGFGGQKFMPESIDKIIDLKKRREQLGLNFAIQVDGGINKENAPLLWQAGADNLVAGSSVFKAPNFKYQEAINELRPSIGRKL